VDPRTGGLTVPESAAWWWRDGGYTQNAPHLTDLVWTEHSLYALECASWDAELIREWVSHSEDGRPPGEWWRPTGRWWAAPEGLRVHWPGWLREPDGRRAHPEIIVYTLHNPGEYAHQGDGWWLGWTADPDAVLPEGWQ